MHIDIGMVYSQRRRRSIGAARITCRRNFPTRRAFSAELHFCIAGGSCSCCVSGAVRRASGVKHLKGCILLCNITCLMKIRIHLNPLCRAM